MYNINAIYFIYNISAIYIIERPSSLLNYNKIFLKYKTKLCVKVFFASDGV
jgi:hypothetical protein